MEMMHFALALLLAATGDPQAAPGPSTEPITVDMEVLPSRHIGVQVKINGKGPFPCIFDTGAPTSGISLKVGKEVGAPANVSSAVKWTAPTIEIGPLKVENMKIGVQDNAVTQSLSTADGRRCEGIFGFDLYSRYDLTIDYKASKLIFTPHGPEPAVPPPEDRNQKRVQAREVVLGFTLQGDTSVIESVNKGSAADAAGLKSGDRLTLLDGRWTVTEDDVYNAVALLPAGVSVPVQVTRAGKTCDLKLEARQGL